MWRFTIVLHPGSSPYPDWGNDHSSAESQAQLYITSTLQCLNVVLFVLWTLCMDIRIPFALNGRLILPWLNLKLVCFLYVISVAQKQSAWLSGQRCLLNIGYPLQSILLKKYIYVIVWSALLTSIQVRPSYPHLQFAVFGGLNILILMQLLLFASWFLQAFSGFCTYWAFSWDRLAMS